MIEFLCFRLFGYRELIKTPVDKPYTFIAMVSRLANTYVVRTQTGYLRWYALSVACGLIIILVVGVLL